MRNERMFGRIAKKVAAISVLCAGVCGGLSGCSGGTSGSSEDTGGDFVGTPESVGTMRLSVCNETLAVGSSCGFGVTLRNAVGQPISDVPVICDTEAGLALIEPNTGTELTGGDGIMSGSVGCAQQGSLRMMCRVSGAFLRESATVKCQGRQPQGFTGFPNAGGGGLNGGGGVNRGSITIQSVAVSDGPASNTRDIDLLQDGDCDNDVTTNDPEPYGDSQITFVIKNNTNSTVTIPTYSFEIEGGVEGGTTYSSPSIALQGDGVDIEPQGTATFVSIFAHQVGTNGSRDKFYAGDNLGGSIATGTRNVQFDVLAVTPSGEQETITAQMVLSFANFNRCS
jgi:hypothetical protein